MGGLDVVGIAKTGSGKTLAFTLPFLARSEKATIASWEQPSNRPRMLLLAPTRELAQQSSVVATEFVKALAPKEDVLKYPRKRRPTRFTAIISRTKLLWPN